MAAGNEDGGTACAQSLNASQEPRARGKRRRSVPDKRRGLVRGLVTPQRLPEQRARRKQMADVITSERESVVVPAPQWGVATRKYVVEAIGAFFLTFAVGVAVLSGSVFTPLAAGATLMVMIYAGGPNSGVPYNPSVTMGGRCSGRIGYCNAVRCRSSSYIVRR